MSLLLSIGCGEPADKGRRASAAELTPAYWLKQLIHIAVENGPSADARPHAELSDKQLPLLAQATAYRRLQPVMRCWPHFSEFRAEKLAEAEAEAREFAKSAEDEIEEIAAWLRAHRERRAARRAAEPATRV